MNIENKINEQADQKQIMDTENILMVARWSGGWRMGKKGEGIKKYKLVVTEYHEDVKSSLGNIVNNIVITMYGVRWV